MTDSEGRRVAQSIYRGIRLNITQQSLEKPCLVTLATKQLDRAWDQWDLLFPAIRVPVPPDGVNGYLGILSVVNAAIQALDEADKRYR